MSSTENSNSLPVFSLNVPGGGQQQPVTIQPNTPIYSSYTGDLIGYGNQPYGVKCDAAPSHKNYGKDFHVIDYNPANGSHMMHGYDKK